MVAQLMLLLFTNARENETLLPEHRLRKINKLEFKRIGANDAKRLDTACACECVCALTLS